jgi:NitT/TauT family transport system permease protein
MTLTSNSAWRRAFDRCVGLFAVALAWELTSRSGLLPAQFFPPISSVFIALVRAFNEGGLILDMTMTLLRTLQGLLIATIVGIFFAILTSTSRIADGLLAPIVELLRPIPSAAMIPIAIFFVGIGRGLFIFTVVFASVWPIYVVSANALRSADRTLIETGRSFGCGRWALLAHIRLPNAMPEIVTGVRIGGGMALLAAILVEMLAGQRGLGYRLFETAFALRTAEMFGLVILCGFIGILLNYLLLSVSAFLTGWQLALSRRAELDGGATA